jgi:hypothetical protein
MAELGASSLSSCQQLCQRRASTTSTASTNPDVENQVSQQLYTCIVLTLRYSMYEYIGGSVVHAEATLARVCTYLYGGLVG